MTEAIGWLLDVFAEEDGITLWVLAEERAFLLEQVCTQADEVMIKETPVCEPTQPSLF